MVHAHSILLVLGFPGESMACSGCVSGTDYSYRHSAFVWNSNVDPDL